MSFLSEIQNTLSTALGPFGLIIIVGAMAVILIGVTLVVIVQQRNDPLERLKREKDGKGRTGDDEARLRRSMGTGKLDKYSTLLEPQNEKELSDIKLKLIQAGYHSREAVQAYHLAQFGLGIFGLILGVAYYKLGMDAQTTSTQDMLLYTLGPGAAGYMGPKYWVTRRAETRKGEIESGFPDALDMLLVCVEAGQSLDQSIIRVAKELHASYPALAEEFEVVAYEMKAGKDKSSVLADMAERCGVQDIASFVTVLIQSTSFGTSIADALRVYAGEMRDKRVMRAEEKANKLPTKMTLATMMLTVPPLLIILVGPAIVGIAALGQ